MKNDLTVIVGVGQVTIACDCGWLDIERSSCNPSCWEKLKQNWIDHCVDAHGMTVRQAMLRWNKQVS